MKKVKSDPRNENKLVIFQAKNGALELRADNEKDTLWASLNQIADIFGVQKAAISKHIKNIYESGELEANSTVSIMETVQIEGSRQIKRNIEYYNLDMIISIGYRVNSVQATRFRQWATGVLREYTTQGFVVNKKIIKKNLNSFIEYITPLLPAGDVFTPEQTLELVSLFSDTWISLDNYDKGIMIDRKVTKKTVKLTADELLGAIMELRTELISQGSATDIFATERSKDSIAGIIGNIMQSFGGSAVYPSIQEKAAHLLYFMVKNHPFVDGNKRSGAFAFVWFLNRAKILDTKSLTPIALTALTLLVAESNPVDKDQVVRLIVSLITKK